MARASGTETLEERGSQHSRSRRRGAPRPNWIKGLILLVIIAGCGTAVVQLAGGPPHRQVLLAWAPPVLSNPTVVQISGLVRDVKLDPSRDYVLRMPSSPLEGPGGLTIEGGHNVVVIGGEIVIDRVTAHNEIQGRCVGIFGSTGVVHIEGLWCHGADLFEGIDNFSDAATVQVENVRIDHIHSDDEAHFSDGHPDLIELDTGRALRVDRFTGSSDYQGFFLANHGGTSPDVTLRDANISGDPTAQQLFWQNNTDPVSVQGVYVKPPSDEALGTAVWPSMWNPDPLMRPVAQRGGGLRWNRSVGVTGEVQLGAPAGGDFVPLGVAGLNYRTPGYSG